MRHLLFEQAEAWSKEDVDLDAELTVEIMDLLVSAATRGTAVFVATHDAVLIERYGKRTVKLEDGRIVEDNPGARGLP